MTFTLASLMFAIALILFVVSALPPVPYGATLARLAGAFLAAGFLVAGVA